MTSITDLPTELILDIIEFLVPCVPLINSEEALKSKPRIVQEWRLPTIFDDTEEGEEKSTEKTQGSMIKLPDHHGRDYSDLKALRLINRYFQKLCTPLLFIATELDIVPRKTAIQTARDTISQYGQYIRYLRIAIRHPLMKEDHPVDETFYKLILDTLEACHNTTSLALYYEPDGNPHSYQFTKDLNAKVASMITGGSLSHLGIYSHQLVDYGYSWGKSPGGIKALLRHVCPLLRRSRPLKHLEIASESIPQDIYDDVRSNGVLLHSISFFSCLTRHLSHIWSPENAQKWSPSTSLTHLKLINCQSAYPPHIPDLVRHFTSLRCLLVSACGDHSDVVPPSREPGWSKAPDALWRARKPLETLFIEHMLRWEILAMGTIPSKTVIATSNRFGHLEGSFVCDSEIFPHLALLRIEPPEMRKRRQRLAPEKDDDSLWQEILSQRGILIEEDAHWLVNSR